MTEKENRPKITQSQLKGLEFASKLISMYVRNELEDFHVQNIPDNKMKELNRLIRNAVFTALRSIHESKLGDEKATAFLEFNRKMIPPYWEKPVMTESYRKHKSKKLPENWRDLMDF